MTAAEKAEAEARRRYDHKGYHGQRMIEDVVKAFKLGAEWQALQKMSEEKIEAAAFVATWLDDDELLRIPDNEWGQELYAALKLLVKEVMEL